MTMTMSTASTHAVVCSRMLVMSYDLSYVNTVASVGLCSGSATHHPAPAVGFSAPTSCPLIPPPTEISKRDSAPPRDAFANKTHIMHASRRRAALTLASHSPDWPTIVIDNHATKVGGQNINSFDIDVNKPLYHI